MITSKFQIISITITAHLLLNIILKSNSLNVVKKGRYCDGRNMTDVVFDVSIVSVETFIGSCVDSQQAYVIIDLKGFYDIHYVSVFEGRGNEFTGQFDFFIVHLIRGDSTVLCSEYPKPSPQHGEEMRVNCKIFIEMFSSVRVSSRYNEGLTISEIEVHTLDIYGKPNKTSVFFRGCSSRFEVIGKTFSENLFDNCHTECFKNSYMYFALKRNLSCYCNNIFDDSFTEQPKLCKFKCTDNIHSCGGLSHFSVYLIQISLPRYIGCFRKPLIHEEKKIIHKSISMTIAFCLTLCQDTNYAILKKGDRCFCSSNQIAPKDYHVYDKCNFMCLGNDGNYCGGLEYWSVYEMTCRYKRDLYVGCYNIFKCLGKQFDVFGRCTTSCEEPYVGRHCLHHSLEYLKELKYGVSSDGSLEKYHTNINSHFIVIIFLMMMMMIR